MKYTWNFTFWKYKYVWMQKPYFATPISLGGNFYLAGGKWPENGPPKVDSKVEIQQL